MNPLTASIVFRVAPELAAMTANASSPIRCASFTVRQEPIDLDRELLFILHHDAAARRDQSLGYFLEIEHVTTEYDGLFHGRRFKEIVPAHLDKAAAHKGNVTDGIKGPELSDGIEKKDLFYRALQGGPPLAFIPGLVDDPLNLIGTARDDGAR